MKEKVLFIINPVSGIGRQKIVEPALEENLNKKSLTILLPIQNMLIMLQRYVEMQHKKA